jgi:xylose dehydrogenase (NAD/NADP)
LTRFGILSTADINGAILAGAAASDEVEIVAVASRDRGRAEAYARERGIPRAHGSYDALLADPDVEAVYVSLPNSLHAEWSIRALEAGKHVLCEKPMSGSVGTVEAVFDAAEASGRICMEALMWRHHPQTLRLKQLVDEGAIGDVRLVRAAYTHPIAGDPDHVRKQPELDGGSLMDLGCYCVSALRLVAGEPTAVTAQRIVGPTGVDVRFAGTLTFAGGVLGMLDSGFDVVLRAELEVFGLEGSIRVSDPWESVRTRLTVQRGDTVETIDFEPADAYRLELENLSRAIGGAASPLLGRDDAIGQARTIEALLEAA